MKMDTAGKRAVSFPVYTKEREGPHLIKRTVKNIAKMVKGTLTNPQYEQTVIHGVATDTRKLEQHQLFIPLKGEHFNGHTFVPQALMQVLRPFFGIGQNQIRPRIKPSS